MYMKFNSVKERQKRRMVKMKKSVNIIV